MLEVAHCIFQLKILTFRLHLHHLAVNFEPNSGLDTSDFSNVQFGSLHRNSQTVTITLNATIAHNLPPGELLLFKIPRDKVARCLFIRQAENKYNENAIAMGSKLRRYWCARLAEKSNLRRLCFNLVLRVSSGHRMSACIFRISAVDTTSRTLCIMFLVMMMHAAVVCNFLTVWEFRGILCHSYHICYDTSASKFCRLWSGALDA